MSEKTAKTDKKERKNTKNVEKYHTKTSEKNIIL